MSFQEFKKIVDFHHGLMEIKIQGVGEPFINKEFLQMIQYARKKMLWVRTTTNGSYLHVDENYKKLIDSGVHDINISIDGASKKVFESIRRNSNFELVTKNCNLINDYNNKTRKIPLRAWVVMQEKNKHEFLKFPKFFSELGFKEVTYSFAMHNYARNGSNKETSSFSYTDRDFDLLFRVAKEAKIKVTFFFYPHFEGKNFCRIPFQRIYVTTDGHVVPCCYIANQDIVDFGHVSDFEAIWFEKYNSLRDAHSSKLRKDAVPDYCKGCYSS